jgi:hypothetical protein
MISFEEYKKLFSARLMETLPSVSNEEKIRYISGIDFEDHYRATKLVLESPTLNSDNSRTLKSVIDADCYELFLLYPEY